jgi:O-antigen ligase
MLIFSETGSMEYPSTTLDSRTISEGTRTLRRNLKSQHSLRERSFYFTLGLVFVRCSQLHEVITYQFHFNSLLLFILGIPALWGFIESNSIARTFRLTPGYLWLGFSLWLVITVPFSFWKSGALELVGDYWRTNVIVFVLLGGLVRKWKEFEWLLRAIAVACVLNFAIVKFYARVDESGRMSLPFGVVGNSNDYAAHILMLLPSLLWVTFTARSLRIRIALLGMVGYGVYAVLGSASRGALVALVSGTIYYICFSSGRHRVWAVGIIAVIFACVFGLESQQAIQRMLSFSKNSHSSEEAIESSDMRQELLRDAISIAVQHPIFGVGPRSFVTFDAKVNRGRMWHEAHNSYAEVAAECGLPAFLFFTGALTSSFLIFWRIGQRYRSNRRAVRIFQAALCMQLMMVMFCIAAGFLNFAYYFHFPLIVGISLAMFQAERSERLRLRSASTSSSSGMQDNSAINSRNPAPAFDMS